MGKDMRKFYVNIVNAAGITIRTHVCSKTLAIGAAIASFNYDLNQANARLVQHGVDPIAGAEILVRDHKGNVMPQEPFVQEYKIFSAAIRGLRPNLGR